MATDRQYVKQWQIIGERKSVDSHQTLSGYRPVVVVVDEWFSMHVVLALVLHSSTAL